MRFTTESFARFASKCPSGWVEAARKVATESGGVVEIADADFEALRLRYLVKRRGLGDVVETLAKPIARALRLDCLDENDKLKPESPCAKKRDALNRITRRN